MSFANCQREFIDFNKVIDFDILLISVYVVTVDFDIFSPEFLNKIGCDYCLTVQCGVVCSVI